MTTKAERILALILSDDEPAKNPVVVDAPAVVELNMFGKVKYPMKHLGIKFYPLVAVWDKAKLAGDAALRACEPTPMVVQEHANMLDDKSPVVKQWFVSGGVCGFASLHVKAKGKGLEFVNELKKAGLCSSKGERHSHKEWQYHDYYKGFYYWVSVGGQSMQLKEAWAHAAAEVLQKAGIPVYVQSRMD